MDNDDAQARVVESALELQQFFAKGWLDRWILPNPFVTALFPLLQKVGVELADFAGNKDANNLGETWLNISVRNLNASIRIGLGQVTFSVANPAWEQVPKLLPIIDEVARSIRDIAGDLPSWQQLTLAFHVTPGEVDFRTATSALVNPSAVGEWLFYGVGLYGADNSLVIDKSLRHEGAAFVRLQRKYAGNAALADIAARLFEDEVGALRLLGISAIP